MTHRRPNGDERSLVLGAGLDLATLREYVPGDDVRRIDWTLTARSDRPYVRESHAVSVDVLVEKMLEAASGCEELEALKRSLSAPPHGTVRRAA